MKGRGMLRVLWMLWMWWVLLRVLWRVVLRELRVVSVLLALGMALLLLLKARRLLLLWSVFRRNDRLRIGIGIRVVLVSIWVNDVRCIRIHNPVP